MEQCVMSTCDQPSGPGGLCDAHHAQANSDADVIRSHIERENAMHPTMMAWAKANHERQQCGKSDDDWDKEIRAIQRQLLDEVVAKVDREFMEVIFGEEGIMTVAAKVVDYLENEK